MFREIFRSRKFITGLILLFIGASILFLRPVMKNSGRRHSVAPVSRQTWHAPSSVRTAEYSPAKNGLKEEIDRKIERVLSLIDELLE